ncbi:MBL fold metallo-hydrolase [Ornithobacterium rhinotracheale]|uniref:MBL fold metallo-hydrolase n=1 Tax=Ornithobacterium rhinotracheale TaxID=28251 RepID=UPI001FF6C6FD|nr:MBL fold metallo-hydrolase [Ornithobacterium rhinotracheale]
MIVRHQREAMVFDTPTDEASSEALIHWIKNELKAEIKWVVPTHFHDDNLGGLPAFHRDKIMSIAYYRTQNLSKSIENHRLLLPFQLQIQLGIWEVQKSK